jgi:phosphoglycerate dehydrogenase-like enzyme
MTRVVSTGPVAPVAEQLLGPIAVAGDDLRELARDAEALIVRGGSVVDAAMIDGAPRLRVIARTGVGLTEVDLEAATRRGIPVVFTPYAGARAVAEGALALLLALAKQLPLLDRVVREGRWHARDEVEIRDLEAATLGIVGFGRIGRELARLVEPFDARVLAYDPYVERANGVALVPLETLFAESDYVSLHAPLTEETRGLVDADLLARAKPGLILSNLARGALVRSPDDLLAALDSGRLAAVGLDVFEPEPPDLSHPLFRHPRVLLTPHALGLSRRARERIYREVAEGVLAVFRGDRPRAVANPEVYGGTVRPPAV